ncbi:MAG: proline dehydrogenase family protein [Acidobacteria bacterium]|nr:proline dehydrogenase family protein [Acidobacteriota bacterium]MCO5332634.1 proline dehydrogenase family protein [Pyrinomonadaceae bacterium]
MSEFRLDLQDTAVAFADRTDAELKEKHRLFKLLNSPALNSLGASATKLALKIGLPVQGLIKSTIYKQFCGGETIAECDNVIRRLGNAKIGTILDYAIEGKSAEADFDATKDEIIRTIERAKNDPNIPFSVFKVSGIAPFGTLGRMSAKKKLDAKSQAKCERIKSRFYEICRYAYDAGQPIFVDAEESWTQDAVDRMTTEMMEQFNRERPIVFNTLQMYRTDRLQFLKDSHQEAVNNGYFLGVKLVRGAYMEKERERAAELGYESPIYPTKQDTDTAYDAAIEHCLRNIDEIAFVAATHNEASTEALAAAMYREGVPVDHEHVFFSQLYGMGDNISYLLADNGYRVSKYVPYGPVSDTVPYLIRRAEENSSAAGHMSRELVMLQKEIKRRSSLRTSNTKAS